MRNASMARRVEARPRARQTSDQEKTWTPHQTVRRAVAVSVLAWAVIIGVLIGVI